MTLRSLEPTPAARRFWRSAFIVSTLTLPGLLACGKDGARTAAIGDTAPVASATDAGGGTAATAEKDYAAFVARGDSAGETEQVRRYTAEGLRKLAAALAAANARGGAAASAQAALDSVRVTADSLETASPQTARHADLVRRGFLTATDAMIQLQSGIRASGAGSRPAAAEAAEQRQARYLTSVAASREAAQRIDAARPLLEQAGAVRTFFVRADEALRQLPAGTTPNGPNARP